MFRTIKIKILGVTVGVVLASLVATTLLSYVLTKAYNARAMQQNLATLEAGHVASIGEWVASRQRMIASLKTAALEPSPLAEFRQIARAGDFSNVYAGYADKSMQQLDSTGFPTGYDPTNSPWYKAAKAKGKPTVTAPYLDPQTKQVVVSFPVPISHFGELAGVVSGNVPMKAIVETVRTIKPTPSSFAFLVDGNGTIVAHPDAAWMLKPAAQLSERLTADNLRAFAATEELNDVDIGGRHFLLREAKVPGTDWVLVIALDKGEANAGLKALVVWSLGTAAVVAVLALILVGAVVGRALTRLSRVQRAMQAIASGSGDLTRRLDEGGADEVTAISASFNVFVNKIHTVLLKVRDVSDKVDAAAAEIAAGNAELSARTEQTAANLQQAAAAMEEIDVTGKNAAGSVGNATAQARDVAQAAAQGHDKASAATETMARVEEASTQVGSITSMIEGIAFQTNILALNAAVEAARAGEQGRGFAVVAAEVRTLAQRSANAAKEIKTLVESTVGRVQQGSQLVRESGESMHTTVQAIGGVATLMEDVARATTEQSRGIDEVSRSVGQLDEMTQRNASLVEEAAAASMALREQAATLSRELSAFIL
ncbi:methyl-accepting chemotaxis protein [Trinickia dinghuensis]|uniref:Methyl-accepting chemotaxis protein n=1 Tax=Trinickia dinghuensis TaxID=2291023 RepID=A0A3D8K4K4_9BURK|nr:methyl-accepting chemotaxis protein [Trinickia dinghuensis]RDV00249.1 methyl-accepting chemotaxis protein [Trinickia dinghuensis]